MYLKNKLTSFLFLLLIFSCQPVEIITPVNFDITKLKKFSINANNIIINLDYNPVFSENNIEDQLNMPPIRVIQDWINTNIKIFGNQNELIINILDASILKKEIDNLEATKYEEKTIYQYEVFFLVQYELYDNSKYLIASTTVETSRSTTSQKYISLNETELIVNDLILKAMTDFADQSKSMVELYMQGFIQ